MAFKSNASVKEGAAHPMEKVSSSTLKRHPKMDLNKADMLQLLSYLEGELQAREVTIAALQAEKLKQFLYQAKYGRFGLVDPLHALQRDSELVNDNSFDEAAIKAMYDDQLMQLENLIVTQQKSQLQMREQLVAVENQYQKTNIKLEEEKLKHSQDMEQGDNVTYMLEKDRERLKQEVEFEKIQGKRMEKEIRKTSNILGEGRASSNKHKQVAVMLIRERTVLVQELLKKRSYCSMMVTSLREEHSRSTNNESFLQNTRKIAEAEFEQRINEFDFENDQLQSRLTKAEGKNRELSSDLNRLRLGINVGCSTLGGPENTISRRRITDTGAQSSVVPARHPHVYISERTVSPTPVTTTVSHAKMLPSVQLIPYSTPALDMYMSVGCAGNSSKFLPEPSTLSTSLRATFRTATVDTGFGQVMSEVFPLTKHTFDPQLISCCVVDTQNSEVGMMTSINVDSSSRRPTRIISLMNRGIPPPVPPNKPQVINPLMNQTSGSLHEDTSATSRLSSSISSKIGVTLTKN